MRTRYAICCHGLMLIDIRFFDIAAHYIAILERALLIFQFQILLHIESEHLIKFKVF